LCPATQIYTLSLHDALPILIHHSANLDYRFDQLLRCEDVTQAQGWVEDLAHGAGVDDAPGVIESLQTWKWGTGITKFRIVIVLRSEEHTSELQSRFDLVCRL